jgi:hypothetical protein
VWRQWRKMPGSVASQLIWKSSVDMAFKARRLWDTVVHEGL